MVRCVKGETKAVGLPDALFLLRAHTRLIVPTFFISEESPFVPMQVNEFDFFDQ